VEAEVDARAQSEGRLVFECRPALVDALGGRGTFVGRLRVEFRGDDGAIVSGELEPLTIAIRPGGLGALSGVLTRERSGRELLARLGITPRIEDAATERGVIVQSFPPESLADRSGVHKGDRVVALGPMRVDDLGDLVPPPGVRSVELVIDRPGLSQPVRVPVALTRPEPGPRVHALHGATFAVGLALLLLLLLSPAARFTTRVCRAAVTPGPSVVMTLLAVRPVQEGAPLLRRVAAWSWIVVAISAVVVAFGVLPFVSRLLPGAVDAGVLVTVAVGLAAAVRAAADREEPLARRLSGVLAAGAMGAPAIVAIAAVAVPIGSFRIEALSAAQGGVPWAWAGLSSLPALLALPAALISLLLVPLPPTGGATALVLDRVRLFVGASLFATVFLGGFRLPFFDGDPLLAAPALRLAASLFFVGKALMVVVVASRLRRSIRDVRRLATTSALFALAAASTAALGLVFPAAVPPTEMVGPVALAVLLTTAAVGVYGTRRYARTRLEPGVALFS